MTEQLHEPAAPTAGSLRKIITDAFILARTQFLDWTDGKPTTPIGVCQRMIGLGRCTGKTEALIKALPDDGKAIVLIWKHGSGVEEEFKYKVGKLRGPEYPIKNLRFLGYMEWKQRTFDHVRGLQWPVFV